MATITIKDVYLIAAPIAAAHIANPCNNINQHDEDGVRRNLENAVRIVKSVLMGDGVVIANNFQDAVLTAADNKL